MSATKPIIATGHPPTLNLKASRSSKTLNFSSASANPDIVVLHQSLFSGKRSLKLRPASHRSMQKDDRSTRKLVVCSAVQPAEPPPEPPFNFFNWIVGVVFTVVLPFFSHKWSPILKLKNGVDTAVETIEVVADAVEKVAEGVEKAAEHIAEDLPEGGRLRQAVDFVENVAERTSNDAHLVGDFIHKVHEAEEKVEEYVESLAEEVVVHHDHEHHGEEDQADQPKETNNTHEP